LAKSSRRDRRFQVTICCSDHANVYKDRLATASSFEFALLQHAQERNLRLRGKITDLIQKNRSAVGRLEPTQATLNGAGEGAFLVTEKFGCYQRRRDCSAIDAKNGLDERFDRL
jgi:hypothetical protein